MPNSSTFDIKPIHKLISKYIELVKVDNPNAVIIDPFANRNKLANITNDLDETFDTDYHLDALDFLKMFEDNSVDMVLFDSPYSPRQVSECYKKLGKTVDHKTTQSSYWSNLKKEIGRIVKSGGYVITFAWNSGGISCQEHSTRWLLVHPSIIELDKETTWEVLSGGDYYDYDIYQGEVL